MPAAPAECRRGNRDVRSSGGLRSAEQDRVPIPRSSIDPTPSAADLPQLGQPPLADARWQGQIAQQLGIILAGLAEDVASAGRSAGARSSRPRRGTSSQLMMFTIG